VSILLGKVLLKVEDTCGKFALGLGGLGALGILRTQIGIVVTTL